MPVVFDCLDNRSRSEKIRIVLCAAKQSLRTIAELDVQVPARAATFHIHVRHAPAWRQRSDIRCNRESYRKKRVPAGIRSNAQPLRNHAKWNVVVRDSANRYFAHLAQ